MTKLQYRANQIAQQVIDYINQLPGREASELSSQVVTEILKKNGKNELATLVTIGWNWPSRPREGAEYEKERIKM